MKRTFLMIATGFIVMAINPDFFIEDLSMVIIMIILYLSAIILDICEYLK